jgi:hypothetical protein
MMRTCVLCCAVAGLLGLAVGCDRLSSSSSKATATQRDEAVTAYKVRLDELDKKVAELKDKAEKATGDDKVKLEAKWKEATGKREAVAKKLDELKAAAAEKIDAMKKDADAALADLKKVVE